MTESTHLENLQKIRDAMVKKRRDLASDAINNQDFSETGRCSEIAKVQDIIEGLDGAIDDEKSLQPTTTSEPFFVGGR